MTTQCVVHGVMGSSTVVRFARDHHSAGHHVIVPRVRAVPPPLVTIGQSSISRAEMSWTRERARAGSATRRRARRDQPSRDAIDRRARVRVCTSRSGFGTAREAARARSRCDCQGG